MGVLSVCRRHSFSECQEGSAKSFGKSRGGILGRLSQVTITATDSISHLSGSAPATCSEPTSHQKSLAQPHHRQPAGDLVFVSCSSESRISNIFERQNSLFAYVPAPHASEENRPVGSERPAVLWSWICRCRCLGLSGASFPRPGASMAVDPLRMLAAVACCLVHHESV